MGKQRTEKSRYQSQYSPGKYITVAQYILELICENKATFEQTTLPMKFWRLPAWKTFFSRNLRQVHKLLKQFNEQAVLRALHRPEFKGRYSIFTPFFWDLVRQEHTQWTKEKNSQRETIQTPLNRDTIDNKTRPRLVEPNILTKLDEHNEQYG